MCNGEHDSQCLYAHSTFSWSEMTLKLKREGCVRTSQAKRKQRGKQGDGTASGKILSKGSTWNI